MNATKRLLIGAAIAAGALGIGAGAFFACRQELSPGAQDGSAGAERRPSDAKYDDGDYDFYFKNGAHVKGDCDGYNSEPGGKTTVYEYFRSEINRLEKRLKAAGINPEVYRTSKAGKYCWMRFDTDLLNGISWEGRGSNWATNDELDLMANGTRLNIKKVHRVYYANAHGNFDIELDYMHLLYEDSKTWLKQDRDVPAILIVFEEINERKERDKTRQILESAGVSTLRTDVGFSSYIISDASNISWFAHNQ